MPKVLLLTGPGGAGKSTVAQLISEKQNFVYLDGDQEDTEFFPEGDQWLPQNKHPLRKAHEKILEKAKQIYRKGQDVVVDYIIFGEYERFIEMFRRAFGDDFRIVVLFPPQEELMRRDRDRECWITGPERIAAVFTEFESIKQYIGVESFLDTNGETSKQTAERISSLMDTNF